MSKIQFQEVDGNYKNKSGEYNYRIKWIPPKEDGYIVQYVEVDDPLHIIGNYTSPYYEAWIVKDGKTECRDYDDKFNNDGDGTFDLSDTVQERLKEKGCDKSHIMYRCKVYWIPKHSNHYETVDSWVPCESNMSKDLPCSFGTYDFGDSDLERCFRIDLVLQD